MNPTHQTHPDEYGIAIRVATFNLRNFALPNVAFYDNQEPYSEQQYYDKRDWTAQQLDNLNADVVVFQEVFQLQALQDALSVSRTMCHAQLFGRDAVKMSPKNEFVPQVAIASRLPFVREPEWFSDYTTPITPPDYAQPLTQITRAVPHAVVKLPNNLSLHVLGLHLKSKRPDYLTGEDERNDVDFARATTRSLLRRAADAMALREHLGKLLDGQHEPCVVAGDFNDSAQSVTSQLIAGAGRFGKGFFDSRLFDAQTIQTHRDPLRNVLYSHIHEGMFDVLDQIFVSEEFHPQSRFQLAQVRDVYCLNDHLHSRQPFTSDHGQVVAQLLFRNGS